jgi:hypothetical protein
MPPRKKTKVAGLSRDVAAVTIDQLDDVLADIFAFFRVKEIMQKRCVCKKWKEAVKMTVPAAKFFAIRVRTVEGQLWRGEPKKITIGGTRAGFHVDSPDNYNALRVMTTALPNLQQLDIGDFRQFRYDHPEYGREHKYVDGDDPDQEYAAETANWTTHDIEIISNFSKLKILEISFGFNSSKTMNGNYPVFFNFPLLQILRISKSKYLKVDLEMLAGLPLLKVLYCYENRCMTGNINSLRVLKATLEEVTIDDCPGVEGNFMDLADFPHLKELYLEDTAVTGDIRDIGENDFVSLKRLELPKSVYGGNEYEFQRISDGPDLIRAAYLLNKQHPSLQYYWTGHLSEDSPDWYQFAEEDDGAPRFVRVREGFGARIRPPFKIRLVKAGPRAGYQWKVQSHPCEVNWLDPEPDRQSSDYEKYVKQLEKIEEKIDKCRGFYQPPTEEQYQRL